MSTPLLKPFEITREPRAPSGWSERLDRATSATNLSRSPLAHPLFLAALALLIFNDHFLKSAELLPGFITGKLSDFAGLLVAPIVLVVLFRARTRAARALCFASVAVIFAAIKLSPDAARLFERGTALIGMPWSVFVDPTDLIGLASYPLAWRISRARGPVEHATLAVAAIACAASSPASAWSTGAYLLNRTEDPIELSVRWPKAELDCEAIPGRVREVFGPEIFGDTVSFTLESKRTLPLEEFNAANAEGVQGPKPCEAALVKVPGLGDTLVFWTESSRTLVPLFVDEEDDDDLEFDTSGMMVLEENDDGELAMRANAGLEISDLVGEIADPACVEDARFEWSTIGTSFSAELVGIEETADGCLALDFQLFDRIYVCAPKDELPFAEGDLIAVESSDEVEGRALKMVRRDESEEITFGLWSGMIEAAPIPVKPTELESCGRRLSCGSYAVPVSLVPRTEDPSIRMVVGSAEHLIAGAAGCETGRDVAGYVADILWVRREVK